MSEVSEQAELTALTPSQVVASIIEAQAALTAAQHQHREATRAADTIRYAAEKAPKATLEDLKETYRERATELSVEAGSCPREHWGSHMDPSDVRVAEDGLVLSWDINGDYAPHYFTATWEQLLAN